MKKILITLSAFIICFALVGCGSQINLDDIIGGESGETGDNGDDQGTKVDEIKLFSDDTKLVFNFQDVYTIVYYYSGETITGLEYYYNYGDASTASYAKMTLTNQYKEGDNIESITQNGKYLIVKFKPDAYKDTTASEVKQTYSYLNQVYADNN